MCYIFLVDIQNLDTNDKYHLSIGLHVLLVNMHKESYRYLNDRLCVCILPSFVISVSFNLHFAPSLPLFLFGNNYLCLTR